MPFPYQDKVACALLYIYNPIRLASNSCFFTIGARPIAGHPAAIGGLLLRWLSGYLLAEQLPVFHFSLFRLPTTYTVFLHCLESF